MTRRYSRITHPSRVQNLQQSRPYWWQWLTVLSLDAVAVSVAWQLLFARLSDLSLRPASSLILGLSVWLAYTADRWIEGWRLSPERVLTQRHLFAVRRRWSLFVLWCIFLAADLFVAMNSLSKREFSAGFLLLIPVSLYLFSHQFLHRKSPWRLPKEFCVAGLIVGGTIVFIVPNIASVPTQLWVLVASFGVLCFINLALISLWERHVDAIQEQDSLARKWTHATRAVPLLPWLWAAVNFLAAFCGNASWRTGFLCVAASSLLLGCMARVEHRYGRQLARTFADVFLLTPIFPLLWRGFGG